MSIVIKHLEKFISYTKKSDTKKYYFPETTSIEKNIKINDLIKKDKEQLSILGEFLLFLIAISSKINTWIDKIDEMDSETVSKYEVFLEKFFYITDTETPQHKDSIHCTRESRYFRKSNLNYNTDDYNSEFSNRASSRINGEIEREKFQRLVNEVEKDKNMYMEKLNDSNREIEILKESNKQNLLNIEDLLKEICKASEFKRLYEQKEHELNDMKNAKELQILSLKEDKSKLMENLENTKDKVIQMSYVQTENEKLKIKLKELSLLKDKNTENTTLLSTIESKERIIDTLAEENQSLLGKLEKFEEDLSNEKKKNMQITKEHENLIFNFNSLNNDFIRIKKFLDRKSIKLEEEEKLILDDIYSNEHNNEAKDGRISHYKKTVRSNIGNISEKGNALLTEISDEDNLSMNDNNDIIPSSKKANKKGNNKKIEEFNDKFSFEESDDERNKGITLNNVIGDRISAFKNNFVREKKDPNNFMSSGSFILTNKKGNSVI